jgi:NAD-dependent SIR2 family protein deacetylase
MKCKKCGEDLPQDEFYFNKRDNRFLTSCKKCVRKAVAEYKVTHYGYWRKYYVHKEDPWGCRR